jgi:hypothetical protein
LRRAQQIIVRLSESGRTSGLDARGLAADALRAAMDPRDARIHPSRFVILLRYRVEKCLFYSRAETSKGRSGFPGRPFLVHDVVTSGAWRASRTVIRRDGVAAADGLKQFRPVMEAQFRHG